MTYDDQPPPTGTGLVTVNVHLDAYSTEFTKDTPKFCQPTTYCAASGDQCVCASGSACTDPTVRGWAIKDLDCPVNGYFAFGIAMPGDFKNGIAKPPVPGKFSDDTTYNWIVPLDPVNKKDWGTQCKYSAPPV